MRSLLKFEMSLPAPESVLGVAPALSFEQKVNLGATDEHFSYLPDAGLEPEPIPELEHDQTAGW